MEYLRENTGGIEEFFIDETFCDITGIPEYFKISTQDFLHIGFWELKEILGKNGANLRMELMGISVFIVKKSQLIINFERAFEVLYDNNLDLAEIGIMFRYKLFKQEYIFIKIPTYSNSHDGKF